MSLFYNYRLRIVEHSTSISFVSEPFQWPKKDYSNGDFPLVSLPDSPFASPLPEKLFQSFPFKITSGVYQSFSSAVKKPEGVSWGDDVFSFTLTIVQKYDPGRRKGGIGESNAREIEDILEGTPDTSKCVWIPLMKRRHGH